MNTQVTPRSADHERAAAIWRRAQATVDAGGTLAAECYTDPSYLAFEQRELFQKTWVLAGVGSQIPEQGDAISVDVARRNVILVRDEGAIRALTNICPHRGVCIVEGERRGAKAFTCPYHRWSFGLKGQLRTRPHVHGGGQHEVIRDGASGIRLEEFRSAMWNDLIFVNISGTAPPLETHLAPLIQTYEGYDFSQMTYCGSYDLEAPGNWKLLAENFLDNYHIFAAHPSIDASMPQHMRSPARYQAPSLILGGAEMDPTRASYMGNLPPNPHVAADLANRNNFMQVFPNVLMHIWSYVFMTMQLIPVAPDKTIERYFFYFYVPEGQADALADEQMQAMEAYRTINRDEDFPLVVAMQNARAADEFDQGILSDYWDVMIREYGQNYVEAMRASATP